MPKRPAAPSLARLRQTPLALALLIPALALAQEAAHAAPRPAWQVNQVGFLPGSAKWAALEEHSAAAKRSGLTRRSFQVLEHATGRVVYTGRLGPSAVWPPAGQAVRLADFSKLNRAGLYRLRTQGTADSTPFLIAPHAYQALGAASLKAFYYQRASSALPAEYAGVYARPAGHADTQVRVHASAASPGRPEGFVLASPKGWYDAGDYNKYIVNSGITVYTLLAAYEHFPAHFAAQRLNIPDSGPGLPDLLQEVRWNLDWMLSMQDPADGGVYHKLSNAGFDGAVMPHEAQAPRYVLQKSTAAALNFAAVMAVASRVYAPFDAPFDAPFEAKQASWSAQALAAAKAAWAWAQANPQVIYQQPPDIQTGEYGDARLDDEFAWAAAELYISTREPAFYAAMKARELPIRVPAWNDVAALAWMSLAHHRQQLTPEAEPGLIAQRVSQLARQLTEAWRASPYRVAMQVPDYVWGSNAVALNQALMLIQGYRLSGERAQLDAAQAALDYVLGRNPLGLSMVTGFGARSPQHPHHRPSQADGVVAPLPGFVVGGPNPERQDAQHCPLPYPSALPALAYLDHDCSYASNEVAINWNAPLAYVAAALQALNRAAKPGPQTLQRSSQR